MNLNFHFADPAHLDSVRDDLLKDDVWQELGFASAPTDEGLTERLFTSRGMLLAVAVDEASNVKLALASLILDDGPPHFEVEPVTKLEPVDELRVTVTFVALAFKRVKIPAVYRYLRMADEANIRAHLQAGFEHVKPIEGQGKDETLMMISRKTVANRWLSTAQPSKA